MYSCLLLLLINRARLRLELNKYMMAGYIIRRAFSCRNLFRLRTSALSVCENSPVKLCTSDDSSRVYTLTTMPNFIMESRRAFAKGRKSKVLEDEGSVSTVEVPTNVGPIIKASAVSQMEAAMAALSVELSKLRTGRASPGMLDHIIVETGGVKMPLNRIALVSVLDPKTLSVNPYDPETLKQLENAIVSSPLGLNPKTDGERLIAVIPPLTKEHMQAMNKLVTKSCEDTRQSIRRARQKAMDAIKKLNSSLPKDDIKRLEKEVDDLTKKFIKSAEDVCKAKEKEISQG
ncbi:ribosome-recycling factor-like isoform X3 [Trifolium pratense]|nr:ribosome-recycling factor-like isoform X3 [Trifolium pratense]